MGEVKQQKQSCTNCRFARNYVTVDRLSCCRRAPKGVPGDYTTGTHPFVFAEQWCGEWEAKAGE